MEMMFKNELQKKEAHERINSNSGTTISTQIKIELKRWGRGREYADVCLFIWHRIQQKWKTTSINRFSTYLVTFNAYLLAFQKITGCVCVRARLFI